VFTVRVNLLPTPVAPGDAPAVPGLVSAEAVEIELRPARLPSRALALLFDLVVVAIAGLPLLGVLQQLLGAVDAALASAATTVTTVLFFVGYPALSEIFGNGRSIGKRALGLRVVREDGGPLRARHAFTRALVGLAVEFPGLLVLFVCWPAGIITMLASARGRRLGDLAAGTLVVHERDLAPRRTALPMPYGLDGWAAMVDLAGVDDDLALELRQVVSRAYELHEPYRTDLVRRLAGEVAGRITPPPPPGLSPWLLLVTVLAERRRRHQDQLVTGRVVTYQVLPAFGARTP
jgi:uncharacterized RDD family membrane protein YckC